MTGTIQSLRNQLDALTAEHRDSVAEYNADNQAFNALVRANGRGGAVLLYMECDLNDALAAIRQQEARIREMTAALNALTARVAA